MSIIIKGGASANLADVTAAGELKTSGTIMSASGVAASGRPDGELMAAMDPTGLFFDAFETFDTSVVWTTYGTAPTLTAGAGVLVTGATSAPAALSAMRSQASFSLAAVMFLQTTFIVQVETGPLPGVKRWWGLANLPASPTIGTPIQSGVVFELNEADGALYGVVYSGGVRTQSIPLTRPTDGAFHRYSLYHRTSRCYFTVDGVTVGSIAFPNPASAGMGISVGTVVGPNTASATPVLNVSQTSVGDTGRNSLQLSDGTYAWRKAQVGRSGGLSIKGAAIGYAPIAIAAGATATAGPVDVSEAGNVTFTVKNTVPTTGATGNPVLVFEQSDDAVSWGPLPVTRADTSFTAATHMFTGGIAAGTSVSCSAAVLGVNYVRVRVTAGTATGGLTIAIQPGGLAFVPSTSPVAPSRTLVSYFANGFAVPATSVEGAVTLTRAYGVTANTTGTSFVLTAGRRFRITNFVIGMTGNAVATAANIIFRLRYSASGAVTTTTTPILLQARAGSPAMAGGSEHIAVNIPDGMELYGDGNAQIGITCLCNVSLNAPTGDVNIVGYEY